MPLLSELLSWAGVEPLFEGTDATVKGVTADSRKVEEGFIFFAISGNNNNGEDYIPSAIAAGASVIVHDKSCALNEAITHIATNNVRLLLAELAEAFYSNAVVPRCVAITGTNGKTSVAEFYRQICMLVGKKSASIGTLGLQHSLEKNAIDYPSGNTSPDPILLSKTLNDLAESGIEYCAVEASSHGLDQYRLDGVHWHSAAFTNFTRDHMDYHATEDAYFAAKMRLFSELDLAGNAVICADNAKLKEVVALCKKRNFKTIWTYGRNGKELTLNAVRLHHNGMHISATILGEEVVLDVALYGEFQALNIVCAMALAMQSGVEKQQVLHAVSQLKAVRGRLEKVAQHINSAPVFVDYAHTPDALQTVLENLRPHTEGKLRVVFGCGGDRDKGKRPLMGEVAAKKADDVVITDDNPRTEDAAAIRAEIIAACSHAKEIADRAEAINTTIQLLEKGDVLVIAGKGHETYQIIGTKTHHFNDAEIAGEAIAAL